MNTTKFKNKNNNQNELFFPTDGPIVSGSWYNPSNGDSFTVRDSFIEDSNFIIVTTDGRRIDANIMQNYIQSDEKTLKQLKENNNEKNNDNEKRLIENLTINSQESNILTNTKNSTNIITGNLQNDYLYVDDNVLKNKSLTPEETETQLHIKMIEKVLENTEYPEMSIDIKITDNIKNSFMLLKNIMNLQDSLIIKIMKQKYKELLSNKLEDMIENCVNISFNITIEKDNQDNKNNEKKIKISNTTNTKPQKFSK